MRRATVEFGPDTDGEAYVTIDQDLTRDTDNSSEDAGKDLAAGNERAWRIGALVIASGLVGWFLWAWLALGRVAWDALGESVASGVLILLAVTIVGVVRSGRK